MKKRVEHLLFNGYVRDPIPMVFFAVIVAIALLILAVWATVDLLRPVPFSSVTAEEVFVEYQYDGPIIILRTTNGQKYDLPTDAVGDDALLKQWTNNGVPVLVEYSVQPEADSRDVLSVSALDKSCIISRDAITQARSEDTYNSLYVLWGVCILYIFFISISYYFLSNAPKYPRISALLIREPYRNF